MKKIIILAGGTCPKRRVFRFFREKLGYSVLVCADGGLRHAKKLQVIPEYIVGDFDSSTVELREQYKRSSQIVHITRQSDTDMEKAIKFAMKLKATHLVLMGADGGRLDHAIANLGYLLKYGLKVSIAMISNNSILHPIHEKIDMASVPGETVSIYSFSQDSLVTTSGLKYKLQSVVLPFGEKESTSNVAIKDTVRIDIGKGRGIVVRSIDSALKMHQFYER